jgi:hypothetical protein
LIVRWDTWEGETKGFETVLSLVTHKKRDKMDSGDVALPLLVGSLSTIFCVLNENCLGVGKL